MELRIKKKGVADWLQRVNYYASMAEMLKAMSMKDKFPYSGMQVQVLLEITYLLLFFSMNSVLTYIIRLY